MAVRVRGGVIAVDDPPPHLKEELRKFNGDTGEYEDLYSLSFDGKVMLTLPGFVERIKRVCPETCISRICGLPKPDIESAVGGLDMVWKSLVKRTVTSNGGIVCIPDIFGELEMTAAILRAFPHDALLTTGLPMTIVAAPDDEMVQMLAMKLRQMLPDRDIGAITSRRSSASDDIVVMTYTNVKDMARQPVGLLVACDLSGTNVTSYAGSISAIKDATRFGLYSTPLGDEPKPDIVLEGLFGQVVARCTYSKAVEAGVAVPITVCWLSAPKPKEIGLCSFELAEAQAMQENPDFCSLVAELAKSVPSEIGVVVSTNKTALAQKVACIGNMVLCDRKTPKAQRRAVRDDLINGVIRRVVATYDLPLKTDLGVMILATCENCSIIGRRIPWRRKSCSRDRAYIIDFRHVWDIHNGRPGYLIRNDDTRVKRYAELGFSQMALSSVNQLPFIGA